MRDARGRPRERAAQAHGVDDVAARSAPDVALLGCRKHGERAGQEVAQGVDVVAVDLAIVARIAALAAVADPVGRRAREPSGIELTASSRRPDTRRARPPRRRHRSRRSRRRPCRRDVRARRSRRASRSRTARRCPRARPRCSRAGSSGRGSTPRRSVRKARSRPASGGHRSATAAAGAGATRLRGSNAASASPPSLKDVAARKFARRAEAHLRNVGVDPARPGRRRERDRIRAASDHAPAEAGHAARTRVARAVARGSLQARVDRRDRQSRDVAHVDRDELSERRRSGDGDGAGRVERRASDPPGSRVRAESTRRAIRSRRRRCRCCPAP